MDNDVILKILNKQKLTTNEVFQFIYDYIYYNKKEYPTTEQMKIIFSLVSQGLFSLSYAAEQAILSQGKNITKLYYKNGTLVKVDVT